MARSPFSVLKRKPTESSSGKSIYCARFSMRTGVIGRLIVTDMDRKHFLITNLRDYARIPSEELDELIAHLRVRRIQKNDHFLRAGDYASKLANIYSGFLGCTVSTIQEMRRY